MKNKDTKKSSQRPKNSKIVAGAVIIFLMLAIPCAALENLDQMEIRKARKTTNQFYSGESGSNGYLWQPQTLCYTDITTGHEVWVMTNTDNATAYSGSEYGHQPWSADGKRFAIALGKQTSAFTHDSYYADETWFTVNTDGSNMRVRVGAPARIRVHSQYTQWSPSEPDVYYEFGRHYAGETGFDSNMLYKVTVNDNGVNSVPWVDYIPGNTSTERDLPKDAISSDGRYALATQFVEQGTAGFGDLVNRSLRLPEYSLDVGIDDYWYNTGSVSSKTDWHDEMFVGGGGNYWVYFLYTTGSWWRMRPWGSDGNRPNHTVDRSLPYDWWVGSAAQTEIQPVNGSTGVRALSSRYFSHGVADRWGSHFAYSDVDNDSGVGPGAWNIDADTEAGYGGPIGCQYSSWNGFTDYTTGSVGNDSIYYMKYDTQNSAKKVAYIHVTGSGGQFVKPGQSPDGTKTAFRSGFLQPSDTNADVFFVVNEYPYPPEITQAAALSGTVNIRFDWRLGTATPRGYTKRGWPNEATDNPPAPRETKLFRLWRSPDGTTWEPRGTVAANPFDKFDFMDGGLKSGQVDYWEISDNPGDGTWYYAVTAVEQSGIESRTLSNVFRISVSGGSGSGVQSDAYPANPGGKVAFWNTQPSAPIGVQVERLATAGHYQITWSEPSNPLIRYYNIYYSSSSNPQPVQQNRIASIPVGRTQYVDWLADTSANAYYTLTSVDTQGNETNVTADNQSPTAASNLGQTYDGTSVSLSWTGSTDNVEVVGYRIYRNDQFIGSSAGTNFIDENPECGTTNVYYVTAYDFAGNESAASGTVSVAASECSGGSVDPGVPTDEKVVIALGEDWLYFKGITYPGDDWKNISFNDSAWLVGPSGIGYGDSDDSTVLSDMQNNYVTVYMRKQFNINDPSVLTKMTLLVDFDDGFVAYINGQEVARENVPAGADNTTVASANREAGTAVSYDLSSYLNLIQPGNNVLAIETHNATIDSSDVSMLPQFRMDVPVAAPKGLIIVQ